MTACLTDFDLLLARARSEYLVMPGLSITVRQASRLWNTKPEIAEELLGRLVNTQFLKQRENGSFVWTGVEPPQARLVAKARIA